LELPASLEPRGPGDPGTYEITVSLSSVIHRHGAQVTSGLLCSTDLLLVLSISPTTYFGNDHPRHIRTTKYTPVSSFTRGTTNEHTKSASCAPYSTSYSTDSIGTAVGASIVGLIFNGVLVLVVFCLWHYEHITNAEDRYVCPRPDTAVDIP
jgi:hypothetical protein